MRRILGVAAPVRSCVGCGRRAPKAELLRIVRGPDGSIVRDPAGRTPGRGAYVCSMKECLEQAVKRGRLGRALRTELDPGEIDRLRREFSG